ncbi:MULTISPECIES: hypothetical protein [Ensifer]|uniref:J domain-containing protein n=1 Tax=Ensifer adhaerens TaxID=106592 RepID=A0ABY8HBG9_ENSAD|nr:MULTISPECIES: hypothetical protein [Ensifer]KSV71692.1 hypothetical protein N185_23635 [Sinorhizobium sp. GW3]OWZ90235.1 hypothetical protein B9J07_28350 [Sinorhizobium sp. LM21]ANK73390.1 hypothetical protein FA04_12630 [Ensifer adhaerens]KDP74796.1 hypothetical protein FA04_04215 [Ensifer adhaerens]KQX23616.1 hypothetical protein ASD01_27475 [Ensifer sp. Root423]
MFGMSVFQSVLERLKSEEDIEPAPAEATRVATPYAPAFDNAFAAESARSAAFGAVERAYLDASFVEPPPPPVMPDYLSRTTLADVAEELALVDHETQMTLAAKRRAFAALNHPDRLPAAFRANATVRMKLANMLIDEAAKQMRAITPAP